MWFWRKRREKPENKKHELMVAMADGPDREYPMVMADGDIREIAGLMGQTLGVIGRWAAESEGQSEKVAYDLLLDIVKKNMENAQDVEIVSNVTGEQWLFYCGSRRAEDGDDQ